MGRKPSLRLPLSFASLLAASVSTAWAAKWDLVPTLALEETYTDNVRLSGPGTERADWVTQVRPGISVKATGARLQLDARYSLQLVQRAREGRNDHFHQLDAKANAELVKKLLYLEATTVMTQQNISLLAPQAASNVNVTGNRTSLRSVSVTPYVRRELGSQAVFEARYTHSTVDASGQAGASVDSSASRFELKLASGPAYRLLVWEVSAAREQIDYRQAADVRTDRLSASLRRLFTPAIGVRLNVGYDSNNYITSGTAPEGGSWSIGPEWTPTPRTKLSASTGRRHGRENRALDFSHRTRLTTWNAGYTEDVSTARQQALIPTTVDTATYLNTLFLGTIPDPVLRQTAVQNFIAAAGLPATLDVPLNFFTSVPFRTARWQGSFGIHGVRHTVLATTFTQTREALSTAGTGVGDFSASPRTKQTGQNVVWTWRVTPFTSMTLNGSASRVQFTDLGREDKYRSLHASLTRQFQPRVSGSISYRWLRNESSAAGAGYTENALSVGLNMRF